MRIFVFQSRTQRDKRSFPAGCGAAEDESDFFEMSARSLSLPKIGARDKKDRNTSLRMISGEVNRDETVW